VGGWVGGGWVGGGVGGGGGGGVVVVVVVGGGVRGVRGVTESASTSESVMENVGSYPRAGGSRVFDRSRKILE
jgi:hypothetical protein